MQYKNKLGMEITYLLTNTKAIRPGNDALGTHVKDEARLARVVNIDQIRVKVEVFVKAHLHSGIRWAICDL